MNRQMCDELKSHIIPFWEELIDLEYGGYYGCVDFDLSIHKEHDKGAVLCSRILWFFSNAVMVLEDEELLTYAEHAYAFMRDVLLDSKYGGIYWSATYDGKISDSTKHIYAQSFAIYALASYYEVTNDENALRLAMELFDIVERVGVDEHGYLESFTMDWQIKANDKLSENGLLAEKTMNTLLHILEAYTQLYHVSHDEKVADRLRYILDIFMQKIYNQKTRRLEVFFDKKMNSISDLYSYGHDIEASWLLDRATQILGDEYLIKKVGEMTLTLADEVLGHAFRDGAINNECFEGDVDTTRVWWVQAEAIVGFYNAYEKTGDKKYLDVTRQLWEYVKKYIIDERRGGEWFWEASQMGYPNHERPIVSPWKCPYHNGRMCMEIMKRSMM